MSAKRRAAAETTFIRQFKLTASKPRPVYDRSLRSIPSAERRLWRQQTDFLSNSGARSMCRHLHRRNVQAIGGMATAPLVVIYLEFEFKWSAEKFHCVNRFRTRARRQKWLNVRKGRSGRGLNRLLILAAQQPKSPSNNDRRQQVATSDAHTARPLSWLSMAN